MAINWVGRRGPARILRGAAVAAESIWWELLLLTAAQKWLKSSSLNLLRRPHGCAENILDLEKPAISEQSNQAGAEPAVKPSYVDPRLFAMALIDTIHKTADQTTPLDQPIPKIADPQIKTTLQALYRRTNGDVDVCRERIAGWFDRVR
jgi:hypothetical protein